VLSQIVEGSAPIFSLINLNCYVTINTSNPNCKIRIIDDYVSDIIKYSQSFSVNDGSGNLKATLVWDYSFPPVNPPVNPEGVAADGVARLYVKISKIDPNTGPAIESVDINLGSGTSNMLGKVQQATNILTYSNEADNASMTSSSSSASIDGSFWFWYVAPDDFADGTSSPFANSSERLVNLHALAHFVGGGTDQTDKKIKIIRPPLILAHGLGGGPSSWDKFTHSYNNETPLFINSPLLKFKYPIALDDNHGSFNVNAYGLLNAGSNASNINSLQGVINKARKAGYAVNQVDYVAHSMGGSVLRTAATVYKNKFKGIGATYSYKNYENGFVNKFITISTPHNGSPMADLVTRYSPHLGIFYNSSLNILSHTNPNSIIFDFVERQDFNQILNPKWKATPAVVDLQLSESNGGVNLEQTFLKNHLIIGDINLVSSSFSQNLGEMDKWIEFIDNILKIKDFADLVSGEFNIPTFLFGEFYQPDKIARVFPFLENYSSAYGYPNFLGDGDLVVPLLSQTAGFPATGTPNVKTYSGWQYRHLRIRELNNVGNYVKDLLNTIISDPIFASSLPASPSQNENNSQNRSLMDTFSILSIYDTLNIKIISPITNTIYSTDSTLQINYEILDTANLVYCDVTFQNQLFTSLSKADTQTINTIVDPSFIGKQIMTLTGVYYYDTSAVYFIDTVSLYVEPSDVIDSFMVSPKFSYLSNHQLIFPDYNIVYPNSVDKIPISNQDVSVSIADTSIIQFIDSLYAFQSISDTGSTYAIVEYLDFTDTIYFITTLAEVEPVCIINTISSGLWSNPQVWNTGIVPNVCDSVTISAGTSLVLDTVSYIRSIYIENSGTFTLSDSTSFLYVGENDDGNRIFDVSGDLVVQLGSINLNGRFVLNPGSSLIMSGGVFTIDGNTGYSVTSIGNSNNLYEISNLVDTFSFTGGTLRIIDPPFFNGSQSIKCPFGFGSNSTLIFGDGISMTPSGNPNGFGGSLLPPVIGKLVLDSNSNSGNRIFRNTNPLIVREILEVKSGTLKPGARIDVLD
jgi:pimeloyl-ACP methyl ester carboxylesterase